MDAETLTKLVNQVAFPIVMVVWFMLKTDKLLARIIQLLTVISTKLGLPPEGDDK